MTWNYRIRKIEDPIVIMYGICEAYYDLSGKLQSVSDWQEVMGESVEECEAIIALMKKAFELPIVYYNPKTKKVEECES